MYMYMYAYVSFKRCDFLFSALQFQLVLCQLFLHVTCHVKYSKMHLNKYRCMGRNDNNILLLFVCWSRKVLNVGSARPATDRALFHTQHIRATCLEQPSSVSGTACQHTYATRTLPTTCAHRLLKIDWQLRLPRRHGLLYCRHVTAV